MRPNGGRLLQTSLLMEATLAGRAPKMYSSRQFCATDYGSQTLRLLMPSSQYTNVAMVTIHCAQNDAAIARGAHRRLATQFRNSANVNVAADNPEKNSPLLRLSVM